MEGTSDGGRMRTEILVEGQVLSIEDAHGTVADDFGYSWVCVKGTQKAWHYRVPPTMGHTQQEYDELLEQVRIDAKMSEWHKEMQHMMTVIYPHGELEYYRSEIDRRADYRVGNRVWEFQYTDTDEDVIVGRTKDWTSLGFDVTWVLHTNLLSPIKYQPHIMWHGESISTANFPTKTLCKWFKPLELGAIVISVQPLFKWGGHGTDKYGYPGLDIRKDARDFVPRTGEDAIYRFYDAVYNKQRKNYIISGGVTFNWNSAFDAGHRRMY